MFCLFFFFTITRENYAEFDPYAVKSEESTFLFELLPVDLGEEVGGDELDLVVCHRQELHPKV